ncbi:MAG: MnhB domain-containing protein [Myxococcota bacterium]
MNSLILRTAAPSLVGLTALFSIYVLLRGHNEPGGGFIGGLIGASSLAILVIADGANTVRRVLKVSPLAIAGLGLAISAGSGLLSLATLQPFLSGLWWFPEFAPKAKVFSTVVSFDIGVYLVVVGTVTEIVLALEESD